MSKLIQQALLFPRSLLKQLTPASVRTWLRTKRKERQSKRLAAEREAAKADPTAAKTFGYFIDHRRDWLFKNLPAESAEYHHDMHSKEKQKALARRLGLEVAHEYLAKVPLADAIQYIEQHNLERFVIKPVSSKSAVGCRCLVKEGNQYRDLKKSHMYSLQDLEQELWMEYAPLQRPDEWLLEELLLPADGSVTHIEDYKMYCFAGKVELLGVKRLRPGEKKQRVVWYTRDWTMVDTGRLQELGDPSMTPPANADKLIAVAEEVSSKTCYPFLRVDLYDTTRGIVLGEFTPGPGIRDGFNAEWEERLARRWREAAQTLEEGLRSGRIKPLMPETEA